MTTAARTINGKRLERLSYVRQGESVDTSTGEVYREYQIARAECEPQTPTYRRVRGYVTERWMRNHGWLA